MVVQQLFILLNEITPQVPIDLSRYSFDWFISALHWFFFAMLNDILLQSFVYSGIFLLIAFVSYASCVIRHSTQLSPDS
jgi:hypothetical protein